MDNQFVQSGIGTQRLLSRALACLSLCIFFALAVPHAVAQEVTFLSKIAHRLMRALGRFAF
jgi:hypothetical protein